MKKSFYFIVIWLLCLKIMPLNAEISHTLNIKKNMDSLKMVTIVADAPKTNTEDKVGVFVMVSVFLVLISTIVILLAPSIDLPKMSET